MRQNRIRQAFVINGQVPNQAINEALSMIVAYMFKNEKIKAIKLIRSVTGLSLKESKDLVMSLADIPKEALFNEYLDYIGEDRDELGKQAQTQKEFNEELL